MKGEIYRMVFKGRGHEQTGERYAVVLQNDEVEHVSTWLVAPTTGRSEVRAAVWRPEVEIDGTEGRILLEQSRAVDWNHLGEFLGYVSRPVQDAIDLGLRYVLDLGH